MKIIIVEDTPGAHADLGRILEHANHEVVVSNAASAVDAIQKAKPDIALVACAPSSETLDRIAGALRADEVAVFRSCVVLLGTDTPEARAAAYAAGADDVVPPGASAGELANRLRCAERVVRLERRLRERVVELESALRRLSLAALARGQEVRASLAPVARRGGFAVLLLTHTWSSVEELMSAMCGEYLQSTFTRVVGAAHPAHGSPGASISLTDVENELLLDLAFFTSGADAHEIAAQFCGDPGLVDDDVKRDVLLELANSGMGAMKAAFLGEEYRFAGSLPRAVAFGDLDKLLAGSEAKRVITLRSEQFLVHVVVTVRHQGRVKIPASQLREGMVLAADVTNEQLVLLARAGTRLTETTAQKLARLVPKRLVELADVRPEAREVPRAAAGAR